MSDTGVTVPCMTELPRRYDVIITVRRDCGDHPNPAEFAGAAEQAVSARAANIVSAYTASQIISSVCPGRRPARGRRRRPGCRLRRAKASGCVIHPLTGPM